MDRYVHKENMIITVSEIAHVIMVLRVAFMMVFVIVLLVGWVHRAVYHVKMDFMEVVARKDVDVLILIHATRLMDPVFVCLVFLVKNANFLVIIHMVSIVLTHASVTQAILTVAIMLMVHVTVNQTGMVQHVQILAAQPWAMLMVTKQLWNPVRKSVTVQ